MQPMDDKKNLLLNGLKILRNMQQSQAPDGSMPNHEPIQPKGGAFRIMPFLVLIVAVLILSFIYNWVVESEPYKISETFIRRSPEIQAAIGTVTDCTLWFPSKMDYSGNTGSARLTFSVKGTTGKTDVHISLTKKQGPWRIVSANYKDRQGISRPIKTDENLSDANEKAGDSLARGHLLFKQETFDAAIVAYSKAIENDVSNYKGYYGRGMSYSKKNLDEQAIADFRKVVELAPGNAKAYDWLGWLLFKKKRYDESIETLSKSIELRPENGWAFYQRGHCYFNKGDRSRALNDLSQACNLGYKDACRVHKKLKV